MLTFYAVDLCYGLSLMIGSRTAIHTPCTKASPGSDADEIGCKAEISQQKLRCRGKSGKWWILTVMMELSKLDAGTQPVRPSGA